MSSVETATWRSAPGGGSATPRLLADENTSHRFVAACRRRDARMPIAHIATWHDGLWLGLDDASLLLTCADAGLTLVAFDRATLPWHAGQLLRAGADHAGVILFRRAIRPTDYGQQARLVADLWHDTSGWDWLNRVVYVPKVVS